MELEQTNNKTKHQHLLTSININLSKNALENIINT